MAYLHLLVLPVEKSLMNGISKCNLKGFFIMQLGDKSKYGIQSHLKVTV